MVNTVPMLLIALAALLIACLGKAVACWAAACRRMTTSRSARLVDFDGEQLGAGYVGAPRFGEVLVLYPHRARSGHPTTRRRMKTALAQIQSGRGSALGALVKQVARGQSTPKESAPTSAEQSLTQELSGEFVDIALVS